MGSHHKFESEEEDFFEFPKVEVTLNEGGGIRPTANIVKTDINCAEASIGDPLLSALKRETGGGDDIAISQILLDDNFNGIEDFNAEENSTE